jgi:outer membrane protein
MSRVADGKEIMRLYGNGRTTRTWRLLPQLALLLAWLAAVGLGAHAQTAAPAERLTLRQTVTLALQHSPEVKLANLQYNVARREAGLRRSEFLPNLYGGSGAAYVNGFPILAEGGVPALFTLNYDQMLFNPLARSEIRVAEQGALQQQLAVQDASDAVAARAASSYLELAKVRQELDLMRRGRESAQKILDFTKDRTDAGYELPIEVTKAQLTAARVEQHIAQLEDQDDTLADQLRSMLGYPEDATIEVATEDLPAEAEQSVDAWEAQALASNVALKQAESERQATLAHLKGEKGGYWPTISLIGQYDVLAKFDLYDLFDKRFQRNNVIAGVDIKIPIFASRTSAAVSFAQANVTASQMAEDNKRREVSLDVRHKARLVKEMDTSREVARLELDLAQQNLQVLQAQFQQGRASVRDLEAAQLDENDKWLAFLDADFAHQQAQLDLLRTTGQVVKLFQ